MYEILFVIYGSSVLSIFLLSLREVRRVFIDVLMFMSLFDFNIMFPSFHGVWDNLLLFSAML